MGRAWVEPHLVAHILAEDGSFTSIPLQASEAHGDISPSFQLHMFHNCGFCQCRRSIRIGCTITPKKKGYFSQKTRLTQDDFLNWSTPGHSTLNSALWKDDKGKNLNPTTSTLESSYGQELLMHPSSYALSHLAKLCFILPTASHFSSGDSYLALKAQLK